MLNKLKLLTKISLFTFIKWNYFSKQVIRDKGCYIFPKKGAVIDIDCSAKIYLHANFYINNPKYKNSKEEAFLLLRSGAELTVNGVINLTSRATLQLHNNAKLSIGRAYINHNASIIIASDSNIGDGILISRDVKVFDADFHKILDENGNRTNLPKPVIIGNHVWIGIGAIILRGSKIADGAVIAAGSVVMGKVKAGTLAIGNPARSFSNVRWEE